MIQKSFRVSYSHTRTTTHTHTRTHTRTRIKNSCDKTKKNETKIKQTPPKEKTTWGLEMALAY